MLKRGRRFLSLSALFLFVPTNTKTLPILFLWNIDSLIRGPAVLFLRRVYNTVYTSSVLRESDEGALEGFFDFTGLYAFCAHTNITDCSFCYRFDALKIRQESAFCGVFCVTHTIACMRAFMAYFTKL